MGLCPSRYQAQRPKYHHWTKKRDAVSDESVGWGTQVIERRLVGTFGFVLYAVVAFAYGYAWSGNLFRRALGEDSLQGASVHAQTPRGFRDVTTAQFIDALDVFPADAIRCHRILWRFNSPFVE